MRAVFVCAALCGALAFSNATLAQAIEPYPDDARPRGIVEATIAVMVAQGVGSALAKGLGGAITRWFEPEPPARSVPSFQVRSVGPNGSAKRVDPATHVFEPGERVEIRYRPAASGRLKLYGVDRAGRKLQLDEVDVVGGKVAVLGPYRLQPGQGRQAVKLMPPCRSPRAAGCGVRITLRRA